MSYPSVYHDLMNEIWAILLIEAATFEHGDVDTSRPRTEALISAEPKTALVLGATGGIGTQQRRCGRVMVSRAGAPPHRKEDWE